MKEEEHCDWLVLCWSQVDVMIGYGGYPRGDTRNPLAIDRG